MLGAEAGRGGSRQSSNAGMEHGDGPSPGGGLHEFPRNSGPPGPDALEKGGGHPKGNSKVGSARGATTPGTKGERARAARQNWTPEAGTTAVLIEQVQGTRTMAAPDAHPGLRAAVRMARERSPGIGNSVDARFGAGPTDSDGQGMYNLGVTVAQESGAKPRTPMDVGDKSRGLASGEKQ